MRWKIPLAVAVALCLVTATYADYWVETFDNGPTGGFDQVWTPHDWAAASSGGALTAQVYEISPSPGGHDNSYYGIFGEERTAPGLPPIEFSEDDGEFPSLAALQFASVDAVIFDDNGGRLYVEMRINPAQVSARNLPFITTNMQVNTIPGDLFAEQFNFLSIERNPDQFPEEPTTWEADVGMFNPIDLGGVESYGFAESGNESSPHPLGMEGQPYTSELILGFWVIPNADQYESRSDITPGSTLLYGDIRQTDGTILSQSNDDNADGLSMDLDDYGAPLPVGPVGIGFYNDGWETLPSTYEDVTIDQIVAMTYYDGDSNANGSVNGNDFLTWQTGFGIETYASPRDGDADWDADVDSDDLAMWQANFGAGAQATPIVAGVPEASSLVLLLLGGLSLFGYGRRSS
jgi:hypothetical protein